MGYALITGASEGIGKELAKCAAKDGYDLILAARSKDKLDAVGAALSEEFGVKSVSIVSDLSKPDAAAKLWDAATAAGDIDVLVNNAGLGSNGMFVENDWQRELDAINVNMVALTDLMKRAVHYMSAQGYGKIMNVASTAGFLPGPKMAVYHASKAYVLHLSEAVAEELSGTRILISALCPGATKTEFFEGADMKNVRLTNMGMMASAEDVAIAGWRALKAGQHIKVPGIINKIFAFLPRLLPRRVIAWTTKQFYARK
ncbi:SDR family oxidoreductase [uncultured Litoreibacter sp.]|uniref:SDR family NAD(P)-dependent oxidoreductase n=1 Tax=uncultured Litoreibacter sp. TaxID=1392394 RepID=UPI002639CACC|nr:SDR family oxidoreductase [uncultured Litoreibacter sp.]